MARVALQLLTEPACACLASCSERLRSTAAHTLLPSLAGCAEHVGGSIEEDFGLKVWQVCRCGWEHRLMLLCPSSCSRHAAARWWAHACAICVGTTLYLSCCRGLVMEPGPGRADALAALVRCRGAVLRPASHTAGACAGTASLAAGDVAGPSLGEVLRHLLVNS